MSEPRWLRVIPETGDVEPCRLSDPLIMGRDVSDAQPAAFAALYAAHRLPYPPDHYAAVQDTADFPRVVLMQRALLPHGWQVP